jgi:hypothetical protein
MAAPLIIFLKHDRIIIEKKARVYEKQPAAASADSLIRRRGRSLLHWISDVFRVILTF